MGIFPPAFGIVLMVVGAILLLVSLGMPLYARWRGGKAKRSLGRESRASSGDISPETGQ